VIVDQLIENYLNNRGMTKNCVSKTEGPRELIEGFQNLRKDSQIVRPTKRHGFTSAGYENHFNLFVKHCVIHFI